ncbi:MAG: hypothetical protein CVV57_03400 [Tenericutes bacterium HGW-Tenericutes-2]|jgi:hypothetical protein|nr:MAG: hypothetical protein CVV57_03400 [Tenericutes bacterium HGW-Tenericutes-2]
MKKFDLKKSIWNDYILMITTTIPVIFIGFIIFFIFINEDKNLILIFGILAALFAALFFIRIKYIKSFLNDTYTIQGIIINVGFFKDRGRIDYVYEKDNNRYIHGQAVMKNKYTKKLQKGQVIDLLIKKNVKNKTMILDLYFDNF